MAKNSAPHSKHWTFFVAALLVNMGLALALQKGWLNAFPDQLIVAMFVVAALLLVAWVWIHPKVKRRRYLLYTYPRMAFLIFVLGFALLGAFAFFMAHRVAKRNPVEKEAQSSLVVEFMRVGAGRPHGNDKDAVVSLVLLVKNTGLAPTIATLWTLAVTRLNQPTLNGLPRYILPNEPITLQRADGQSPDVYDPSDALYNKTATTPIQPGAAVSGILLFTFPNVDSDSLNKKGTVYTVGCTDVNGDKATTSYTITGDDADAGSNVYFPGLKERPARAVALTFSQEEAKSTVKYAPFAVKVTIKTTTPLSPTSLAIKCSSEFAASENRLLGALDSPVSNAGDGYIGNRTTYWFYFSDPVFKPETPVEILLMAKQPIKVLKVELGPPLPKN